MKKQTSKTYSIPTPCKEDWLQMEEKGPGRHCVSCEYLVVDATKMTRDEFEMHRASHQDVHCAFMNLNEDNQAIFAPKKMQLNKQRMGVQRLIAAAATSVSLLGMAACEPAQNINTPIATSTVPSVDSKEIKSGASRTPPTNLSKIKQMPAPTRHKLSHQPKPLMTRKKTTLKSAINDIEATQMTRQNREKYKYRHLRKKYKHRTRPHPGGIRN